MLIGGGGPLDQAILRALYAGRSPALAGMAHALTFFGEPWAAMLIAAAAAAGLAAIGRRWDALTLLLVNILGRGLSIFQKIEIERLRPDLEPHLVTVTTSSFPSGHTTASTILYASLAIILTRGTSCGLPAAFAAILVAGAVGLSRVMLGVHWSSDVIGGWAFGLLWVVMSMRAADRLVERGFRR